jgi:hypothetical protein
MALHVKAQLQIRHRVVVLYMVKGVDSADPASVIPRFRNAYPHIKSHRDIAQVSKCPV